jgi:hypothetical protein
VKYGICFLVNHPHCQTALGLAQVGMIR